MLTVESKVKLRGAVKWFNNTKGFGFIKHASGRDVFVQYSQIQCSGYKTLKEGEEVEYEIIEGPKGLHALKVMRITLSENATTQSEPLSITCSSMQGTELIN